MDVKSGIVKIATTQNEYRNALNREFCRGLIPGFTLPFLFLISGFLKGFEDSTDGPNRITEFSSRIGNYALDAI